VGSARDRVERSVTPCQVGRRRFKKKGARSQDSRVALRGVATAKQNQTQRARENYLGRRRSTSSISAAGSSQYEFGQEKEGRQKCDKAPIDSAVSDKKLKTGRGKREGSKKKLSQRIPRQEVGTVTCISSGANGDEVSSGCVYGQGRQDSLVTDLEFYQR